jgi:hypothetical protein
MDGCGDCDGGFIGDVTERTLPGPGDGSGECDGMCMGDVMPPPHMGDGDVTENDCGLGWLPPIECGLGWLGDIWN